MFVGIERATEHYHGLVHSQPCVCILPCTLGRATLHWMIAELMASWGCQAHALSINSRSTPVC